MHRCPTGHCTRRGQSIRTMPNSHTHNHFKLPSSNPITIDACNRSRYVHSALTRRHSRREGFVALVRGLGQVSKSSRRVAPTCQVSPHQKMTRSPGRAICCTNSRPPHENDATTPVDQRQMRSHASFCKGIFAPVVPGKSGPDRWEWRVPMASARARWALGTIARIDLLPLQSVFFFLSINSESMRSASLFEPRSASRRNSSEAHVRSISRSM